MSTILNIAKVSQLTTTTGDGKPSENAQQDCTAAGVDIVCRYVLGTPENSIFNPDNLKDHAYGDAYIGGTAAVEYIDYCKSLGVHLYHVDVSDYAHVVALARQYIRDKHQPCVFTRDDPYIDQRIHPNWSHVSVFYGEDDQGLTAHDPYINGPIYKTDAGWIDVLRSNQLWIAERIDMFPPLSLGNPVVANYFAVDASGGWLCKQTGRNLHGEILQYYCSCGASVLHGLDDLGFPKTDEIPIERLPSIGARFAALAGKGITVQFFELGPVLFDPANLVDRRPSGGRVYRAKLYDGGPGTDPEFVKLQATVGADHTAIAQIKQIVGALS